MAQILHQYTCTIPASTPMATPVTIDLPVPNEIVRMIDVEVPPGPGGLMGFYLAMSGVQLIPFEFGEFIVWDDREREWPLDNYPTTGAWSLVGYNLDEAFDHAVTLRFHDDPFPAPTAAVTPAVTIVTTPASSSVVVL